MVFWAYLLQLKLDNLMIYKIFIKTHFSVAWQFWTQVKTFRQTKNGFDRSMFWFFKSKNLNIFPLHHTWCLQQFDSELKTVSNEKICFRKYFCPEFEFLSGEFAFCPNIRISDLHTNAIRKLDNKNDVRIRCFTLIGKQVPPDSVEEKQY
jgi:hypothetical protein